MRKRTKRKRRRRVSVPGAAVLAVRVPIHVRKAVERAADRDGITMSRVGRRAIEKYVAEQEVEP
jgi:hypothetical protein